MDTPIQAVLKREEYHLRHVLSSGYDLLTNLGSLVCEVSEYQHDVHALLASMAKQIPSLPPSTHPDDD